MYDLNTLSLCQLITLVKLGQTPSKNHLLDKDNVTKNFLHKKLPLDEDQVEEAIELFRTGKFSDNFCSTIRGAFASVGGIPSTLLHDPSTILTSPLNTIALPINTAKDTAIIFVDPNNRTARLAIIIYARLHGINITESNLDDVYNLLKDPSSKNFEKLAEGGLETIKEKYNLKNLDEAFNKFKDLTKSKV